MIKMQTFLKFVLLSATMPVYANEHTMASLLNKNDALGNLPSRGGFPDMSGIMVQGNDARKSSMPKGRDLGRVLQDLMINCNASRIDELYLDPTLNETYFTYLENFDAAPNNPERNCVKEDILAICQVQTIEGEAEYQSACIAAGGQIETIPADLSCNFTYAADGRDGSEYYDLPPLLLCLPADDACATTIRELTNEANDFYVQSIQEDSIALGLSTEASCRIADEAPSSSAADKNGIGFASMTMVLMSLIVGFPFY